MLTYPNPKYPNCIYPNIAAEIELQNAGSLCAFADHAGVTMELLEAFLRGKETLTHDEIKGIQRFLNSSTGVYHSMTYVMSPKLSVYDLRKPKHYRKFKAIYDAHKKAMQEPCAVRPYMWDFAFEDSIKRRFPRRAFVNRLLRVIDNAKQHKQVKPPRDIKREQQEGRQTA